MLIDKVYTPEEPTYQVGLRLPKDLYEWYSSVPKGARRLAIIEAIRAGKETVANPINLDALAKYIDDTNDAIEGLTRRYNTYDLALLALQNEIEALKEAKSNE